MPSFLVDDSSGLFDVVRPLGGPPDLGLGHHIQNSCTLHVLEETVQGGLGDVDPFLKHLLRCYRSLPFHGHEYAQFRGVANAVPDRHLVDCHGVTVGHSVL